MDLRLDAVSREALLQDDLREQRDVVGTKLLYTPEEAAGSLAIGRTKLFELLRNGTLPSVQIGRARRIRAGDLEAFANEPERPGFRTNRCVGSCRRGDVA
jgi:excisionase family DNA binding protein